MKVATAKTKPECDALFGCSIRPACKRAFSLIELLVVIALVAILAALLFTGWRSWVGNAQKAECASNLRQLGVATLNYAADHNGTIYVPNPVTLVAFCGKGTATTPANDPVRFLNPYLGGPFQAGQEVPVARCPADAGMFPGPASIHATFGTSYIFNYRDPAGGRTFRTDTPLGAPFPLLRTKHPSKTLMIACHSAFNYVGGGDRRQTWHKGPLAGEVYVNACMADGSVRFVRIPRPGEPNYPNSDEFTWGQNP